MLVWHLSFAIQVLKYIMISVANQTRRMRWVSFKIKLKLFVVGKYWSTFLFRKMRRIDVIP